MRRGTRRRKNEPEVVVFIPHTPNGELKERLQEEDMKMVSNLKVKRVKFVERGGKSIAEILCRSNPWKEKKCGDEGCIVCRTGAKGECKVESVVYNVECGKCEVEGRKSVYVGETGRSAWERGGDHLRAWRGKEEGSFIWKHESE